MNDPKKMFYDEDADLNFIKNKNIGIIGYGIQGRAQALNLRDSGLNVRIGNRKDSYADEVVKDGFEIHNPKEVADWADIIMFLIPDDAQTEVYDRWIKAYLNKGKSIVFAHGYSIYYNRFKIPEGVDVLLLAPRMPGKYIRERFISGWGVPAFIDAFCDASGSGLNTVLSLAKGIGATRIGVMRISLYEETEIDLFVEQFLYPSITYTIHAAFDFLFSKGFTPEAVISELYASGEIGELIKHSALSNIYQVFKDHGSPTCQYGKMINTEKVKETRPKTHMAEALNDIRSGEFDQKLKKEAKLDYSVLNEYYEKLRNSELVKTHSKYNKIHRPSN